MGDQSFANFWNSNRKRIGQALSDGMNELGQLFGTFAREMGFKQRIKGQILFWLSDEGRILFRFCRIPDPRDLKTIIEVFEQTRDLEPHLTAILVHQRPDGEGNWDTFVISPKRVLQHANRIWGSNTVIAHLPQLREDIYQLFAVDKDFPAPGQSEWAKLLEGPEEGVARQFEILAGDFQCSQSKKGNCICWWNPEGQLEAMFFLLPSPEDLEGQISIYQQIEGTGCPVSFVFVKSDHAGVFDIFRLSSRSYLEHHNQAKLDSSCSCTFSPDSKPLVELQKLRWKPLRVSQMGCIRGCLDYLNVKISDPWLFGGTGQAFVLNICPDLCPSGPTDWDDRKVLSLAANLGIRINNRETWCPDQKDDLVKAQEEAWEFVRRNIDRGIPCYGWEILEPEYYVIYGYDEVGYFVSGTGYDDGAGPVPWNRLGRTPIQIVAVASVEVCRPLSAERIVLDAVSFACDFGYQKESDAGKPGSLESYDRWINAMETGTAYGFGLAYNTAVWSQCRQFAVEFLKIAETKVSGHLQKTLRKSVSYFEEVAYCLKMVSESYPYSPNIPDRKIRIDEHSKNAAVNLKNAKKAESEGLRILSNAL